MIYKFIFEECKIWFEGLLYWIVVLGCDVIQCCLCFVDFNEVFGFMMCVVIKVQEMNYYLEWFNVYNCVDVMLLIYDVDGFIECDIEFVCFIDGVVMYV